MLRVCFPGHNSNRIPSGTIWIQDGFMISPHDKCVKTCVGQVSLNRGKLVHVVPGGMLLEDPVSRSWLTHTRPCVGSAMASQVNAL